MTALLFAAFCVVLVLAAALIAIALADADARCGLRLALARKLPWLAPQAIVAGDSLAACCDFRPLASRPFGVVSLARGGATLPEIAGQLGRASGVEAGVVIVDGGLNDLLSHGASPERIARDFVALLTLMGPRDKVVFTLMPHVADSAYSRRIDRANELIGAICREKGVVALDLNPRLSVGGVRRPEMTDDGLHFTARANALWVEALRSLQKA
ncbi:SGNH/GDSL hydrolase family protein [Methylocystis heyeri]|uniref:SGNH/GDSL hydrolase family protein n=1 Tax=Methylocystis heyeri TaxID=391905 RepID=UPI00113F3FA8|nr:GDSL-type esterase/lipase family protein [Methylocystis heyeri]